MILFTVVTVGRQGYVVQLDQQLVHTTTKPHNFCQAALPRNQYMHASWDSVLPPRRTIYPGRMCSEVPGACIDGKAKGNLCNC